MTDHGGRVPDRTANSIPERLRDARPSVSFEFFPPKDEAGEAELWGTIRQLEELEPAFASITYGAGGTTQERSLRAAERLARESSMTPLAHLTCVGASAAQLRDVLADFAASGVRHVLALRGDPPGDVGGEWTPHPQGLAHADELVSLIRGLGDFTVGVAAFPDVHPHSADLAQDVEVLVRKADAGASFAITQMVFDVDRYLRLRDALAAQRDLPMTPGLMPVTSVGQVARMAELMGTPLPESIVARLDAVAGDRVAVREEGVAIATEIGSRLLSEGAPGLHFITMNRATATLAVHDNLGLRVA